MRDNAVKVAAIASLPRLGFNEHWGCIQDALQPFGIPLSRFQGVFWGQCMQRAFTECVDDGVDWILTIDYDSIFTHYHLDRLLGTFADNPNMGALAPLQTKRACKSPLMYKKGCEQVTFDTNTPFRVDTAHFGLTLIRTSCLKQLPKPWFVATPGPTGEWDDDRTDEDIYFWNRWYDAGFSVYIEPRCRIGHIEMMVSEFGDDYQFRQVHASEWRKREYGDTHARNPIRTIPLQEGTSPNANAWSCGAMDQARAGAAS